MHVVRLEAAVIDPGGSRVLQVGSGAELPTASVGKLWLLAEVAERIVRGELAQEVVLRRDVEDPVGDSGLWQHLSVPELSVADAALLTAAVSDNAATNALLSSVPLDAVAGRASALGAVRSRLHDRVRDVRGPEVPATLSTGVAGELAEAARRIHAAARGHTGLGVTPEGARLLESWLMVGVDTSLVLDPLCLDPLAHVDPVDGIRAWSKTGSDPGVLADVGVVDGPGGWLAYAVIAAWSELGQRSAARKQMREVGSRIAAVIR